MNSKSQLVDALKRLGVLFEVDGDHKQKGRALRDVAAAIQNLDAPIDDILARLDKVPGAGPKVREIVRSAARDGIDATIAAYDIRTPQSAASLIELPGVGAKTIATLVQTHNVTSLQELANALENHSIKGLSGFGQDKLHRLERDVRVLLERQRHWPIAKAWPHVQTIADALAKLSGMDAVSMTGTVRRLVAMNASLDIVAAISRRQAFDAWCQRHEAVSNFPSQYESCTESIRLTTGDPPDTIPLFIHVCTPEAFGIALMESTGDATHRGVVAGLLAKEGLSPSLQGLLRNRGGSIPAPTEESVYQAIHVPYLPPELREGEGILQNPATLVSRGDIRGDLHMHSTWSDGSLTIGELAESAQRLGYEYIAITDHSQSLTIAHGLSPERLRAQRAEIEEVRRRSRVKILHGTEVDILADGSLDFPDEILAELDIVVASVHSAFHQSKADMTQRIIKAISHPNVDILGHMHGRLIGRRAGYDVDTPSILRAAALHNVMVELNSNPNRLDIWDEWLRMAVALDIYVPIDTDAHRPGELTNIHYGVSQAIRGWVPKQNVLNTWSYKQLRDHLSQRRKSQPIQES